MTPKEKAKELVDEFEKILYPNKFATDEKYVKCVECALICVDEIINSHIKTEGLVNMIPIDISGYWQEVKNEIEKL